MVNKLKHILFISIIFIIAFIGKTYGYSGTMAVVDHFDTNLQTKVYDNTRSHATGWSFELACIDLVTTLLDNNKNLNFVYKDNEYIYIQKLNSNNITEKTLKLKKLFPSYGGVTIDSSGYYYIAWGQRDDSSTDEVSGITTFAVSKYDNNGNFIKSYEFSETEPLRQTAATKVPFDIGNCRMAINSEGYLTFHYTHTAKSGHQGNRTGTIDTRTMETTEQHRGTIFVSHCMYNDVIPYEKTKGFAFIGQRDGTQRGYNVAVSYKRNSGIWAGKWHADQITSFRFRDSGKLHYNNTLANYGGIEEVNTGLAVVASSDTTLDKPAEDRWGESRNLFLQIRLEGFNWQ